MWCHFTHSAMSVNQFITFFLSVTSSCRTCNLCSLGVDSDDACFSFCGGCSERKTRGENRGGGELLLVVCGAVTFPHNFESVVSMSLSLFKALQGLQLINLAQSVSSAYEAFFNSKVFDSLEKTQTLELATTLLVLDLSLPSEFPGNLKAHALLFMITISFHALFAFLIQFMCSSHQPFSTARRLQMLMTDRLRLLFSTPAAGRDWRLDTPWTSGSLELPRQRRPTPPAHLALPHHQSGISKSRPPIPRRGRLYFMSRIANGLCVVKSLVGTFLSPL